MPLSEAQAQEVVFSVAKIYPNKVRVYRYNYPVKLIRTDLEISKKADRLWQLRNGAPSSPSDSENDSEDRAEQVLEQSLGRTMTAIHDYVLCNDFDLFCTFTFKDDRQNVERCKKRMSIWFKNQTARKGKFKYLVIPEFHKDGKSLHFHALLKDYPGELSHAINPKTNLPITSNGSPVYNIPSYTLGYNTAKVIRKEPESISKVAGYLKKYITKDMPRFPGKRRYWCSKDLAKPHVIRNPPQLLKPIPALWNKACKYGVVYFYERSEYEKAISK